MGTCNFNSRHESKTFVVLKSWEDDETGETCYPESWDYDELKESLLEKIKATFGDYFSPSERNPDYICLVGESRMFGELEVEVELKVFIDSGYYEAASLTFEVEQILPYKPKKGYYDNLGMAKIQYRNAEKWAEKTEQNMRTKIEQVFTEMSEPYQRVATFSNGEAIYQKIEA